MAEGLLGGVLGDEEERPEVEGAEPAAAAEAFATALAAKLAGSDPGVARKTESYLDKQAKLLEIQAEHLKGEYAARLHLLEGQAREVDLRRFGLRMRVGFQLFLTLVATVLGIGIVIMVNDAITSRRVVVETFDAPTHLAERGLSGKVIAAGLLGELNRLQATTKSSAAKRDLTNAWSSEVELALPEAGVSLGELSRLLKRRFGHDMHIDGDLIETEAGDFELTVRGDGVAQRTFTGHPNELAKLTTQIAEYIYAKSEPALYATYLSNLGRDAEAVAFCESAYGSASPADRPYLLNVWGISLQNATGSTARALELYGAAVRMKPDFWIGYNNIINALWAMGEEEEAWRKGQELLRAAGGRPGKAPEKYFQNVDELTWSLPSWRDATVEDMESSAGAGTLATAVGPSMADIYVRMHDPVAADLALKTTNADANDPTISAISHFTRGFQALDAGDANLAATELEAFRVDYVNPVVQTNYPGYDCFIAPAEELAGHPDKADDVLAKGGHFVDCYRFRGDVLDHRGNWQGAQAAYAAAVALAPDLPAAYYSWGLALMRHGDAAGALEKLKSAHEKGPHWADPLKAWGDVLIKQGQRKDALAKYNEALQYAPNWAALMAAREAARKHTS